MRLSALAFFPVAAAFALAGCHSGQPSPSQPRPAASATVTSQPIATPAPANPSAPVAATPHHPTQKTQPSSQDVAQLDLNSEGGVRDGSFAMWVHVTEHGKSLKNIEVVAYGDASKPVAAARTNEDGDAMLKVNATTYRIAASKGASHGEKKVTFHPGDQFDLELQP